MTVKKVDLAEKVDIWMPMYIGELFANTAVMNGDEFRAYMLIRAYQWRHHAMTEAQLRELSRMSDLAWSNFRATLMQGMSKENDGFYFYADLRALRTEWVGKRQKAREKAEKAANARHRRKNGGAAVASSNPGASQNTQLQDAQPVLTPSPVPVPVPDNSPSLRSGERAAASGPSPSDPPPTFSDVFRRSGSHASSEVTADRPISPRTAPEAGNAPTGIKSRPAQPTGNSGVLHGVSKSNSSRSLSSKRAVPVDLRFNTFKHALSVFFGVVTGEPEGSLPWGERADRELIEALKSEPDVDLSRHEQRLAHRMEAIQLCSTRPARRGDPGPRDLMEDVIRQLPKFTDGPVNIFGDRLN